MSDKPISVGDLVRVSSSHCAGFADEALGVIFVVDRLLRLFHPFCDHCGKSIESCMAAEGGIDWNVPLQFLTRIPPLGELEGEKRDEEITA
jgi:hypothetical protein